jgi:hypothetical protein
LKSRGPLSRSTIALLINLSWAWIALCCAYFLWEAARYRGLYAWLAEKQIAHFGGYVPLFTFVFLCFLGFLPALLLRWVIKRTHSRSDDAALVATAALKRAVQIRRLLFGTAGVVGGFVLGTMMYALFLLPVEGGKIQTVTATDVEPQGVSEGSTRLVGGELGKVATFGQFWFLDDRHVAYAPYRAPGLENDATQLFVQLQADSSESLAKIVQRPSWSGILVEGGLPGTMRSLFASLGARPGEPYFTLYPDRAALQSLYWVQAAQLALLALFFGLLGFLQSRRIARMTRESQATFL